MITPRFWWDLDGNDIIVKGMRGKGEAVTLARIPAHGNLFTEAQTQAEELIADYRAGRKTPEWTA